MKKYAIATSAALIFLSGTALSSVAAHLPVASHGGLDGAGQFQDAVHLAAFDDNGRDRDRNRGRGRNFDDDGRDMRWSRGERLPTRYRDNTYIVYDYRKVNLRKPPRGHRWVRVENRYILTAINGWRIADIVVAYNDAPSREELWRRRYSRAYVLDDDVAYRDCRNGPDPTGVLAGAVIGGLLGRTVAGRGDRTEGAVVGVIAGGAIGAALTNKAACEDRSYMYKTYASGFDSGRRNAVYKWRNPRNNHYGELNVLDYYEDEDDFRCSVYSHTIYIDGRREEARGRACQQPDGSWAIID